MKKRSRKGWMIVSNDGPLLNTLHRKLYGAWAEATRCGIPKPELRRDFGYHPVRVTVTWEEK